MQNAISKSQGQQQFKRSILWGTQKNIEADERWAQKKEELEKKIRKNSIIESAQYNKKTKCLDIYSAFCCCKFMPDIRYLFSTVFKSRRWDWCHLPIF